MLSVLMELKVQGAGGHTKNNYRIGAKGKNWVLGFKKCFGGKFNKF